MSASKAVILAGGPGAGKSNYLFRTWVAIEAGKTALVKNGLPSDLQYLNAGAQTLLEGNFAPHTSRDVSITSTIPVVLSSISLQGTLVVPDASGELWLDLYKRRVWYSGVWDKHIARDTGYVLLVRAGSNQIVAPMDWITSEKLHGHNLTPHEASEIKDRTPTQILLVDWLQILRSRIDRELREPAKPRLSVVVSAWDALSPEKQSLSPQTYLESNLPLFSQFLEADLHGFEVRTFGLSIAGGDLKNDPSYKDIYLAGNPTDSGYVVFADIGRDRIQKSPDITLPILWAIGA